MKNTNESLIEAFQESFVVAVETLLSFDRQQDYEKEKIEKPFITINENKVISVPKFFVYGGKRIDIKEDELKDFQNYLYSHLNNVMPALTAKG